MTQINMHEAKTHLSSLVQRALAGEEIIIAHAGTPAVRLVPEKPKPLLNQRFSGAGKNPIEANAAFDKSGNRIPGLMKGQFTIAEDAFDPMTEEELALWYGE